MNKRIIRMFFSLRKSQQSVNLFHGFATPIEFFPQAHAALHDILLLPFASLYSLLCDLSAIIL